MTRIRETTPLIESTTKLHGHLGPFLVTGVRIGEAAKSNLDVDDRNGLRLVNYDVIEDLVKKVSEGANPEQLAKKIANSARETHQA